MIGKVGQPVGRQVPVRSAGTVPITSEFMSVNCGNAVVRLVSLLSVGDCFSPLVHAVDRRLVHVGCMEGLKRAWASIGVILKHLGGSSFVAPKPGAGLFLPKAARGVRVWSGLDSGYGKTCPGRAEEFTGVSFTP